MPRLRLVPVIRSLGFSLRFLLVFIYVFFLSLSFQEEAAIAPCLHLVTLLRFLGLSFWFLLFCSFTSPRGRARFSRTLSSTNPFFLWGSWPGFVYFPLVDVILRLRCLSCLGCSLLTLVFQLRAPALRRFGMRRHGCISTVLLL